MNRKQKLNKILHSHIEVNPNEDYTNYKNLIAELDSFVDTEIEQSSFFAVGQRSEPLFCEGVIHHTCKHFDDIVGCDGCVVKEYSAK